MPKNSWASEKDKNPHSIFVSDFSIFFLAIVTLHLFMEYYSLGLF
ncbi:hypothetical protein C1G86_1444 [Dehalococcoides mccartyi]|uniref:Uncharacterized protein n=1 Tax=Dehalococcoides mccartyi TaxID=61435 RepID=A0A328ERW7_9CHLR|nr:hypothetical protein C1G87_1407 [Dehalococcoides mccartyi]RAL70119.1 hypothetical protein C1G86_1444 [Dehalococcoides mccartyi]